MNALFTNSKIKACPIEKCELLEKGCGESLGFDLVEMK
jgi:hypothetical protein